MGLQANIVSVGAWGRGFRNWKDLQKLFNGIDFEDDGTKGPKPEVIPANERRRAPLPVRLAVESSWQAVENSPFKPEELNSVFVSALGDTQLTDYMCKVLAGESKQLSPTKFHNSVHNAAAGYWTISTACMKAANSIAGYEESVSLTLLEALTQIENEKTPVLLTFYDSPVSKVLKGLLKNEEPFSISLVLAPHDCNVEGARISAEILQESTQWPALESLSVEMNALYENTLTARVLILLKMLMKTEANSKKTVDLPLSAGTSIRLTIN